MSVRLTSKTIVNEEDKGFGQSRFFFSRRFLDDDDDDEY
jgi:hypothetical protein